MSPLRPQREPDDSTRPPCFAKEEWRQIIRHLRLTCRQAETLGLVITGFGDKEIARRLGTGNRVIRNYIDACKVCLRTTRRGALAYETIVVFRDIYGV